MKMLEFPQSYMCFSCITGKAVEQFTTDRGVVMFMKFVDLNFNLFGSALYQY